MSKCSCTCVENCVLIRTLINRAYKISTTDAGFQDRQSIVGSQAFAIFVNVLLSYPLFSTSGNSLPNSTNRTFSSWLKLVVFKAILSRNLEYQNVHANNSKAVLSLMRHCLAIDWKNTVLMHSSNV